MATQENICVVARVRPLVTEAERAHPQCVDFSADGKGVTVRDRDRTDAHAFAFDRVFSHFATQEDVYEEGAAPLLDAVMNGINAAVIAYGQTGSGKTHTMTGEDDDEGITPRLIRAIFEMIKYDAPDEETFVCASFVQIYRERLLDLLSPSPGKDGCGPECEIRENHNLGLWVTDAEQVPIRCWKDAERLLIKGEKRRVTGETKMNEVSSRSHSLFIVSVCRRNLTERTEKASQLYLCDLAGSESVDKTGSTGDRLEEAKTINTSLLALRMVIDAIVSNASHVPYRDSKLTRMLQNSFGGNARTCLVVCASPSSYNDRETLSTFRFGASTRTITNRPRENVHRSVDELQHLIRETNEEILKAKAEIKRLRRELRRQEAAAGDGQAHVDTQPEAEGDEGDDFPRESSADGLCHGDMPRDSSYELVAGGRCSPMRGSPMRPNMSGFSRQGTSYASYGSDGCRDVPREFLCSLSGQLMINPVTCLNGMTYEKAAIERYLERNCGRLPRIHDRGEDDMEGDEDSGFLIPNVNLRDQIAQYNRGLGEHPPL